MPEFKSIKQYQFPWPNEENGYHVFSIDLEENELIAFHGTAESNLESILKEGFFFSNESSSVSFAKKSPLSLRYACEKRSKDSPNGVVIAVMFESLKQPAVVVETSCIYLYPEGAQPEIIGYCIVPENYQHI